MKRGGEEGKKRLTGEAHAESAVTSDKTGVKTAEGSNLYWFYKLENILYLVLRFKDDFVT
jgi:hypothetical protein